MNSTKNAKYKFTDVCLSAVVTVPEAALMWDKTAQSINQAWLHGHIEGRKTFSKGNILITFSSLVAHYGAPRFNLFEALNTNPVQ